MLPRICHCWEFPGGPVIGLHTSTVEGTGSILGLWALQHSSSQRKTRKKVYHCLQRTRQWYAIKNKYILQ